MSEWDMEWQFSMALKEAGRDVNTPPFYLQGTDEEVKERLCAMVDEIRGAYDYDVLRKLQDGVCEFFETSVKQCLKFQNTKTFRDMKRIDSMNILCEFQTVRIGIPRRSGKSEAIRRWLAKYGNDTVLVFPNKAMADHVEAVDKEKAPVIVTAGALCRIRDVRRSVMIVDEFNFINQKQKEEVYDMAKVMSMGAERFVLVLISSETRESIIGGGK